jgi:cell division protein FtsB
MSQDELHSIATTDTPEAIQVPNTWQGLIVWALARFGVGIAVAGVFGWGIVHVYTDMRSDRQELLEAYRDAIHVMQAVTQKLEAQTDAIEDLRRTP